MSLNDIVRLIQNEKTEELKTAFQDLSERQRCDLLNEAADTKIESFADLLETILDNTIPSNRYQIIIHALKKLSTTDVPETHIFSVLNVVYLNLNFLPLSNLSFLAEFLLKEINAGKNGIWNVVLPRVLQLIVRNGSSYFATSDDVTYLGYNYRTKFVDQLIRSESWQPNVISGVASMLKQGIPLTESERFLIFDKLCVLSHKLDPSGLSTFAFHMFEASFNPKLFVGVLLALDKYFRHYYWKRIQPSNEPEPTQNSVVERFPETRIRQEEDVIITQIFHTMEYNFTERALTNALKEITLTPDVILTPFIFESLIAVTRINQSFNADHISESELLSKIIHAAIQTNYVETDIFKTSFIIKSLFEDQPKALDIEKVIEQIINDSKTGLEVLTPGLFGLAYSFLKNKKEHQQLYDLAVAFLIKFLKQRPLYTKGVFEKLMSLMINEPKSKQYRELLEKLVIVKGILIAPTDYIDVLQKCLDDIPFMTPDSATSVMMICYYLLRKSAGTNIRNLYVSMLRRAITDNNLQMLQMACYGCTLLLKQIKFGEVTTGVGRHNLTAAYITGNFFSQMNIDNMTPHDMMVLEIMGILTKSFCLSFEVKSIMYKGLRKAADANHKALPHIMDFIIPRFRSFVDTTGSHITLKLELLIEDNLEQVLVKDNIGVITELLGNCLVKADIHNIKVENGFLREALTNALDKALHMNFDQLGINTPLTLAKYKKATQFLNFLESIMSFAIWKATSSNGYIAKLLKLTDKYHQHCEDLKKIASSKRKKEPYMSQEMESVWDLGTLLRFLSIFYNVDSQGLEADQVNHLKSNRQLRNKVLRNTVAYLKDIRNEPSYFEIKFSKKSFQELCDCAKISFVRLFNSDAELCCEETLLMFEIFKESILTAKEVFDHKFDKFVNTLPNYGDDDFEKNVCRVIGQLTGMITKLCESAIETTGEQGFIENSYETKLLAINVSVVELFLAYIPAGHAFCSETYEFFFTITTGFTMDSKSLGVVFKVLFTLRLQAKPLGDFYISTASLIADEYGFLDESVQSAVPTFEFKGLTKHTIEPASNYFLVTLKRHLEQNAFLLKKANSLIYRLTKIPGQRKYSQQITSQLKEIEKLSINLLTVVCKVMLSLSNAKIPLGRVADNFWRVLIHLYNNGAKLARIFMQHNAAVEEDIDFYGLKELCISTNKITRPVSKFILYIEGLSTVAASSDKLTGAQAAKKVLKDARFIPKYVYWFEKFSIEIILLSDKTKQDFKNYLHRGVYRDFRIRTEELRNAIQKEAQSVVSGTSSEDFEGSDEDEGKLSDDEELSDDSSGPDKRKKSKLD